MFTTGINFRLRDGLSAHRDTLWIEFGKQRLLSNNRYINELPTGRLLRDTTLYEICAGILETRRTLYWTRDVCGIREASIQTPP